MTNLNKQTSFGLTFEKLQNLVCCTVLQWNHKEFHWLHKYNGSPNQACSQTWRKAHCYGLSHSREGVCLWLDSSYSQSIYSLNREILYCRLHSLDITHQDLSEECVKKCVKMYIYICTCSPTLALPAYTVKHLGYFQRWIMWCITIFRSECTVVFYGEHREWFTCMLHMLPVALNLLCESAMQSNLTNIFLRNVLLRANGIYLCGLCLSHLFCWMAFSS